MLDNIIGWVNLIFQVGDFFVKAARAYPETAQGAKEWADVQAALVSAGLTDIPAPPPVSESGVGVGQAAPDESGQDFSVEDIRAEIQRQADSRAETGRVVYRAPRQHEQIDGGS